MGEVDSRTDVLDYIEQLMAEADSERKNYEEAIDYNLNYYMGYQTNGVDVQGLKYVIVNFTQNAVLNTAHVQLENKPEVSIAPSETNERPQILIDPSLVSPNVINSVGGIGPAQASGMEPLSESQAAKLVQMMQPSVSVAPDGSPTVSDGILVPGALIQLNDQIRSEIIQSVYDYLWVKSDMDWAWMDNVINKGIVGWQDMLVQYDFTNHRLETVNLHPLNVWIDPVARVTTGRPQYYIVEEYISTEDAKADYPEHAELIDRSAVTGPMSSATGMRTPSILNSTQFARDMVRIRHYWCRNYEVPIEPDEALRSGAVSASVDPAGGGYVTPTGEPTDYGSDGWPARRVIRQVLVIGDEVVFDGVCPYDNIPVVRNMNIPIPFSVYGQGEPERLCQIQDELNRTQSVIYNVQKYNQSPQMVTDVELANMIGDKGRKPYSHPGAMWKIPMSKRAEYARLGIKPIEFIDPPRLEASQINHWNMLMDVFRELSGHQEVTQGQVPSGVQSGKAIEALQSAARGVIGLRSMMTERSIEAFTKIVLGIMRDFVPDEIWIRVCSKYPPNAVLAVKRSMRDTEYDVRVRISSGAGLSRVQEQNTYLSMFDRGLMDPETLLEKFNIPNSAEIIAKIQAESRAQAPAQKNVQKSVASS